MHVDVNFKKTKSKKNICNGYALLSSRADYTCDNSIFRISCDLSLLLLFCVAYGQSSELFLFAHDWLIDTHIFKIICIYMNINQSKKYKKNLNFNQIVCCIEKYLYLIIYTIIFERFVLSKLYVMSIISALSVFGSDHSRFIFTKYLTRHALFMSQYY